MGNDTSVYAFLEAGESEENFANCDFALRAGRHIQNHPQELRIFDYIVQFKDELSHYYQKLYGIRLRQGEFHDQIYFYLELDTEDRGRFTGNRTEKLSARHTLFGLLLLKIQRIDKRFGKDEISVSEFKEQIKKDGKNYRDEIYFLFARVSNKSATETDDGNIDTWVDNSLKKFEELGWIYFLEDNKEQFEIQPSFNRLLQLYLNEIKNFEQLLGTTQTDLIPQ